jgi:mannose-6-phosphate isomerase-like protein (cupin superfamily)
VRLVESGRSDVSIGRLIRITKLLDVSVSQLIDDEKSSEITVIHPDTRVRLPVREPGVQVELLSPAGVSSIEPAILTLDGGVAMRKAMFHRGLELLYVLTGRIRLIVGKSQEDLESGDTAFYAGTVPHRLVNTSATETAIVLMADAG